MNAEYWYEIHGDMILKITPTASGVHSLYVGSASKNIVLMKQIKDKVKPANFRKMEAKAE